MNVLITGGAGFIGGHVGRALQDRGDRVTVLDDLNPYYDPRLKRARLKFLYRETPEFLEVNIADDARTMAAIVRAKPDAVIHLAAWPSVRPSREYPSLYAAANILGTVNVLEACRKTGVRRVVFASSSSVYGPDGVVPSREENAGESQRSGYGVTKRAGELYASLYAALDGLQVTCLRFFSVYGPWGRPDMAVWKFTERILRGQPIFLHARSKEGAEVRRDFTEITDIVHGVLAALTTNQSFVIVNLGTAASVPLRTLVSAIQDVTGRKAAIEERTLPDEEAVETRADLTRAGEVLGYAPSVDIHTGVERFVTWYKYEFQARFPEGLEPSRFWS